MAAINAIIPAVTKLTQRVVRILGCNPSAMTLQGTNTYLIGTGKNRILLDAGNKDMPEYQLHLTQVIKANDLNIEHIIVTHWHDDHFGGVENLYDKKTEMPKVWKHKRSEEDEEDKLPKSMKINWLTNGQELQVEGATVKVHHTPGHTTDHVVLTLLEENILFSGDCVLGEGTAVFEDLSTYMESLEKILSLQPEVIFPGHGNVIKDPIAKINYYIAHRNQREEQILEALKVNSDKQLNAMELVKIIYTETPKSLWNAAAYNVDHHLKKLGKENKINTIDINGETRFQYAGKLDSHI